MPVTSHIPSYPKAVKSSTARRQYQRQQRTQRERFTPAQIRQIEREEAQLKKARDSEERDRKRKLARKRKEDKEAKEREERRKLVQEGKLSEEDTWAKCAASQQRLNVFFGPFGQSDTGTNRKRKRDESDFIGYKRDGSVASASAINSSTRNSEEPDNRFFSSSAPDSMAFKDFQEETAPTSIPPADNDEMKANSPTKCSPQEEENQQCQSSDSTSQSAKDFDIYVELDIAAKSFDEQIDSSRRRPSPSDDADNKLQKDDHPDARLLKTAADADIYSPPQPTHDGRQSTEMSEMKAERSDEATSLQPHSLHHPDSAAKEIYSTPTRRVALGKMSTSHINIRASERPDNTTPLPVPSLPSPSPSPSPARADHQTAAGSSPKVDANTQDAAQVLAMICSEDISEGEDDEAEEDEDKENKDPRKALVKLTTVKGGPEPTVKINSSSPATDKADSQVPREKIVGSSKYTLQNDSEPETEYEDLFDNYENDDDDDEFTPVTIPDLQSKNTNEKDPATPSQLRSGGNSNTIDAIAQLALTGSMKNTFVDVYGSPHKPKSTPHRSISTKIAPTPYSLKPIPFALSPHSSLLSAKQSPKPQSRIHTPPKNLKKKRAEASPLKPKNEFSSFGLDGLDEEDLAMMADAFEEAERKTEKGGVKGKGKSIGA